MNFKIAWEQGSVVNYHHHLAARLDVELVQAVDELGHHHELYLGEFYFNNKLGKR